MVIRASQAADHWGKVGFDAATRQEGRAEAVVSSSDSPSALYSELREEGKDVFKQFADEVKRIQASDERGTSSSGGCAERTAADPSSRDCHDCNKHKPQCVTVSPDGLAGGTTIDGETRKASNSGPPQQLPGGRLPVTADSSQPPMKDWEGWVAEQGWYGREEAETQQLLQWFGATPAAPEPGVRGR